MRAQSARAGAEDTGRAGSTGTGRSIAGSGLSPTIIARLERRGIHTFADWLALGDQRYMIFGITKATAERLDAAARVRS